MIHYTSTLIFAFNNLHLRFFLTFNTELCINVQLYIRRYIYIYFKIMCLNMLRDEGALKAFCQINSQLTYFNLILLVLIYYRMLHVD